MKKQKRNPKSTKTVSPAATAFPWITKEALRACQVVSIEPNTPEVRARINAEYRVRLNAEAQ
ncbi:MAG: hypothetical protein ABI016_03550 [Chthoniobacterales bacterium]